MSVVSKSNKCETCQQKITNPITNERHVLLGSYFCIYISSSLMRSTLPQQESNMIIVYQKYDNSVLIHYYHILFLLRQRPKGLKEGQQGWH